MSAPPLLAATAVGAAAGGIVGKFARHKVDSGLEQSLGEKLKPGTLVKIRVSRDKLDDNKRSKVGSAEEPVHTKGKRRKKG